MSAWDVEQVGAARALRPADRLVGLRSPPAALVRALGLIALAASVCASAWIATGAADGVYWLELPAGGHPAWIDGPLRGLASTVGSLPPGALSVSLIALSAAYFVAVSCAHSIRLRFALAAIVLANVAFTLCPTLVSTDVFGYIAYARELVPHGLNPYLVPPSSALGAGHDSILPFVYWRHATSPYGPLFTGLSAPLGLLSKSAALWIFKALAGIASIAIAFLVAAIARRRGGCPARAAILAGLNPIVLFYAVSGAHNDLLAVALVLAGVWLVVDGRYGPGAGVVVAGAAIKLTLGLALPFVMLGARRRGNAALGTAAPGGAALGAAVAIAALGVATVLLFGTHFVDQLARISTDARFDIAFSGPDRLATALGTPIGSFVRIASTGFAALGALGAIVWAWRGGDWITAAGWAFLALIASIASLTPWYLVWLLPLAALGRSRALLGAALLTTCYLLAIHLPALGQMPFLSPAGS
ncbi:MAG: polyprenol phosphomannose-dependent alpha 1,6 mannosyltransferase MptB [Actinomycetota bacterium]|nr:polyprenol phosphomannose-dependent alpha 1,6 mannosyltransferase MptB [Actinomycetota bacterium]